MQQSPTLYGGKVAKPGLGYLNYWAQHGFKPYVLRFCQVASFRTTNIFDIFLVNTIVIIVL